MATEDAVTWLKRLDVVAIQRKFGYIPTYVLNHLKLKEDEANRITLGFSEDRAILYIKFTDTGVKLSLTGGKKTEFRRARSFSTFGAVTQFGKEVIGKYALDSAESNSSILVLKKVSP